MIFILYLLLKSLCIDLYVYTVQSRSMTYNDSNDTFHETNINLVFDTIDQFFYKYIFDMYNCFIFYRKNLLNNSRQLLSRQ